MQTKTLQIFNIIALIITLLVNYLSNTGVFNGNTMASVSAQYQNLFTPAGYAFSIWGLIYIGLIIFVIYQARSLFISSAKSEIVNQVGWWFVLSCVANSFWVFAWLYQYTGTSVLLMIFLLFSLLKIVIRTNMEISDAPFREIACVWWPFSAYAGWISVALIANISAYLTKLNWNGFGLADQTWAVTLISAAGLVNLFITWKRNMREFALIGVWALIAIAIANANKGGSQLVIQTAILTAAILLASSSFHAFQNRRAFFNLFKQ